MRTRGPLSSSSNSTLLVLRSAALLVAVVVVVGVITLAGRLLGGDSSDGGPAGSDAESGAGSSSASVDQRHPDVVGVEISEAGDGTFTLEVTISSPYDSPERYADGWRVLGPDGEVLGEHELAHDHAGEQPFTRTQTGVEIPEGVDRVVVEGRDQEFGYGGGTREAAVPGR